MSCDTAIVRIDRPARESFNFVSAARNLSLWSFGTWSVDIDETGLIQGRSIKDGSSIFVRIVPYPEQLLIDRFSVQISSQPSMQPPELPDLRVNTLNPMICFPTSQESTRKIRMSGFIGDKATKLPFV